MRSSRRRTTSRATTTKSSTGNSTCPQCRTRRKAWSKSGTFASSIVTRRSIRTSSTSYTTRRPFFCRSAGRSRPRNRTSPPTGIFRSTPSRRTSAGKRPRRSWSSRSCRRTTRTRTTSATATCIWRCPPSANTGSSTRGATPGNHPCASTAATAGAGAFATSTAANSTRRVSCPGWNYGSTSGLEKGHGKDPCPTPHPTPPGCLHRLEQLELVSRKIFMGRMKGERLSKRKGQSVEFADFRPYVVGDDLRFLDWNLLARLDRLFLRLFMEEEDLHVYLLIDHSLSMNFGTP